MPAEVYRQVFTGVPADTPELRRAAHRLRYQVFCVENKIFDPADNPGGLERDVYDDHSVQAVLLHRSSQMVVGTVRLVLHKPGAPRGSLPFHKICDHPRLRDPNFLPLETTAEVGRFAISKAFRPRSSEVVGDLSALDRLMRNFDRLLPHMTLALINLALQMCVAHQTRHVCAVMEPSLLRLLARLGFHFSPLGPAVEYHGLRQPCYANLTELFARVGAERRDVWEVTTERGCLFRNAPSLRTTVDPHDKRLTWYPAGYEHQHETFAAE